MLDNPKAIPFTRLAMKNNSLLSLRNGLTVAFQDVLFSCGAFGGVTVHGFDVTLGNHLTLGAHELHELSAPIYGEVATLAQRAAEEMSEAKQADVRERREWFAARR